MSITRAGRRLCLAGALLGVLGLVGWLSELGWLTTIVPGQPSMMPNTAIGMIALGIAGALRSEPTCRTACQVATWLAAGLAVVVGGATLIEYGAGVDLGVDRVVLSVTEGPYPGRPSPPTALALVLFGGGMFVFDSRPSARFRPSEWLTIAGGLTALIGLMGHVFGAGPLYRIPSAPVIGVALPTAVGLLAICVGFLLLRPDGGVMRVATSPGPGGILLRRLIVPAVVGPVVLGLIAVRTLDALEISQAPVAIAVVIATLSVFGLALLPLAAGPLDRVHTALEVSRARTRDLVELASDGIFVADLDGRYTEVNQAGCELLGLTREEIIGKSIVDFIPPEDTARLFAERDKLLAVSEASHVHEWRIRHKDGTYIPIEVSDKVLPDGRWQAFVRNIRARKLVEDANRRAQARIEGIISIASDAIISIDAAQRITIFNHSAERIFGWSSHEVLGKPLDVLVPERHREAHRAHVAAFAASELESRAMSDRPIVGLRKGGGEFPAEAGISKLRLDDELVITIVLRDVTARVTLEHELAEARVFLENVLESSTEYSVIALDLDRRIVLWNAGAQRCYGYAPGEVMGGSVDQLYTDRDFASGVALAQFARALDRGSTTEVQQMCRKHGGVFHAQVSVSRRVNAEHAAIGYLHVSRDVTHEWQRAAQDRLLATLGPALTASLSRAQILDSAVELIVRDAADVCVVDLLAQPGDDPTAPRRRVAHRDPRRASLAAELQSFMLDLDRPSITRVVMESRGPVLVSHVTTEYLDLVAQNQEHRRLLTELAPVSVVSAALVTRGVLVGVLSLMSTDPQHRFDEHDKLVAGELAQRLAASLENARLFELAEHAVAARDEVLRIVAHDLRSPLSTAMLAAETLPRRNNERRESAVRASERIMRALGRANRLIEDLLDISRLEQGQALAIERTPLDLSALVRESVDMHAPIAASARVELSADLPSELPLILADEARVLQVLGNLIGNALKFTPAGGAVRVRVECMGDELVCTIEDTGPGLTPTQAAHVFDRFWQAHARDRRGAGLGLTIARGIVEAHRGRLWVETEVGHGSRFRFALPLAPTAHDAAVQGISTTA